MVKLLQGVQSNIGVGILSRTTRYCDDCGIHVHLPRVVVPRLKMDHQMVVNVYLSLRMLLIVCLYFHMTVVVYVQRCCVEEVKDK